MKNIVWAITFTKGSIVFSIRFSKLFSPNSNLIKAFHLPWLKADITAMLNLISWTALPTTLFVCLGSGVFIKEAELTSTALVIPAFLFMHSFASLVKTGVS